jgi:hypothetical protein
MSSSRDALTRAVRAPRVVAWIATLVGACSVAWPVRAEGGASLVTPGRGATTASEAEAARLFAEARTLVERGKHQEACERFERSQALRPGVGTQFQLAACWERTGRMASAHALFLKVADATRALGQSDRERAARARADALAPKVSRIVVKTTPVDGLEVRRNGAVLSAMDFGRAFPVDPGEYTVSVTAKGKKVWSTRVRARPNEPSVLVVQLPDLSSRALELPALDTAESVPASNHSAADHPVPRRVAAPPRVIAERSLDRPPHPLRRPAMIALAGAGTLGLMAGTAFLEQTIGSNQDANAVCPSSRDCTESEAALHDKLVGDARRARTWAIVGFATGSFSLVAAGYLFFTDKTPAARRERAASFDASPVLSPADGLVGATVRGRF